MFSTHALPFFLLSISLLSFSSSARSQTVADPSTAPATLPPELTGVPSELEAEDGEILTIERIVDSLVRSASNRRERALTAPAWVLTITREEIVERGYLELTDLLDDLPGMDVVRPHGDSYVRTYWRGHRNLVGAPYLLMLDGIVLNHLYLNEADILAAFPLSAVDRVEVVYGPASSLYGANAAMGVINVITRATAPAVPGVELSSRFFFRAPTQSDFALEDASKVAEAFAAYRGEDLRVTVSGRFDQVVLDPSISEGFEYTSNRYYTERRFYGDFLDLEKLAGPFRSESQREAVDLRIGFFNTEIALQHFRMVTGRGVMYPADRSPSRVPFVQLEQSVYVRHRYEFSDVFSSTTLLRFRQSNIDSPTSWLEFDHFRQRTSFEYRQSTNYAYIGQQDFSLSAFRALLSDRDELVVDFGFRIERRDLERDFIRTEDQPWDPTFPFEPEVPGGPRYTLPEPTEAERQVANRDDVDVLGVYAQARYRLTDGHYFNLGVRLDYNSFFEDSLPILRGGYVGRLTPELTVKLLYGQAIQEPTRRELFGSSVDAGPNRTVERERSQTGEVSLSYQIDVLALQANVYLVDATDVLVNIGGAPRNLGERLVVGTDLGLVALLPVPFLRQLKVWVYYSSYLWAEEETGSAVEGQPSRRRSIPDLAHHKGWFGTTADVNRYLSGTFMGRCISDRETVFSNPVRRVSAYCTLDVNARARDFLVDGLWLSLRIANLLDTRYFHPGVGDANSGERPGRWEGDRWVGSLGYFNSLLPQPGRSIALHLGLDF